MLFVMFGFLGAGALAFERLHTDLLVDRHRQIAATAAVGVSEVIESYAHILDALASNPDILEDSSEGPRGVLENASDALAVFNAGVAILDQNETEIAFASGGSDRFGVRVSSQESWESVVAPAHMYGYAAVVLGLLVALFVIMIYWPGIRRISIPIQLLGEQTARLSRGDTLEEFQKTGIQEIDGLERALDKMNRQITAYRVGLRRY